MPSAYCSFIFNFHVASDLDPLFSRITPMTVGNAHRRSSLHAAAVVTPVSAFEASSTGGRKLLTTLFLLGESD
jgi:hypothetical protein